MPYARLPLPQLAPTKPLSTKGAIITALHAAKRAALRAHRIPVWSDYPQCSAVQAHALGARMPSPLAYVERSRRSMQEAHHKEKRI